MLEPQRSRLQRIFTQNFYLIAVDELTTNENQVVFRISGSTANLYTVTMDFTQQNLSEFISCDCPDGKRLNLENKSTRCKHACFVLIKILKQSENCLKNSNSHKSLTLMRLAYEKLTIHTKLTQSKYRDKYLQIVTESTNRDEFKVTQNIDQDTDCPICYEQLITSGWEDKVVQCPVCKNPVHTECIQKWLDLGNETCVYCRENWSNFNQASSFSGKYMNLGNLHNWTYYGSSSEEIIEIDEEES